MFANLNLDSCIRHSLFDKKELEKINNCLGYFPKLFFEKYPNYPVKRIKLDTGQAYLAPTDNILHDGSSMNCEKFDLSIVSLGDFFPIKDKDFSPKFAFA